MKIKLTAFDGVMNGEIDVKELRPFIYLPFVVSQNFKLGEEYPESMTIKKGIFELTPYSDGVRTENLYTLRDVK